MSKKPLHKTINYPNGDKYVGEVINSKPHGEGIFYNADGSRYEGGMYEGLRHGKGCDYRPNGDKLYGGEFLYGAMHGKGIYYSSTGLPCYEVQYDNGKQISKKDLLFGTENETEHHARTREYYRQKREKAIKDGTYVAPNEWKLIDGTYNNYKNYLTGDKFIGTLKDDKPHGKGEMFYSSGGKYIGEFEGGVSHGKGVMVFENEDKYDGDFADGLPHGIGQMEYANLGYYNYELEIREIDVFHRDSFLTYDYMERYEGEWCEGRRHGMGTAIFFDNSDWDVLRYEGKWKDDEMHGLGKIWAKNGYVYEGGFSNNERIGKCKIEWKNGDKFEGEIFEMEHKPLFGVLTAANGGVYENNLIEDSLDGGLEFFGKGTMCFANGDKLEGDFLGGSFDFYSGSGVLWYAKDDIDGRALYEGSFDDGEPFGKGTMHYINGDKFEAEWDGYKNAKGIYHCSGGAKRQREYLYGSWIDEEETSNNG